jgi:hypothetical protein
MANRGWLHQVPPVRLRPRRRRYYELHDALGAGIVYTLGCLVWIYEMTIWLTVWFYYALFLGCAALVRQVWPLARAAVLAITAARRLRLQRVHGSSDPERRSPRE